MELRDYLRVVRRRWLWILACTVVTTAAAVGVTMLQTPQYASSARLFVSTSAGDQSDAYQGSLFSAQRVTSYADLVTSRELAADVAADLSLDVAPEELAKKVEASVVADTVNLIITVTDPDPAEAQRVSQAYAEGLVDMIRQLETPPGEALAPIKATIVDAASYADAPVSPQPLRNTGLGLVLGLLLGFGLAVLREVLDTRVRSEEDLLEIAEAPVIGAIGHDPAVEKRPLLNQIGSHSPRAEAFRVLRTNLQFIDVDSPRKIFVVTSAVPQEGKSTTAVNLAISLAQAGVRTLLVDGDLRRPRAATLLDLDAAVGVTTVLLGRVTLADALQTHEPSGLDVLASGSVPPNPAELIQSAAMADLLTSVRAAYDVVIVDAPPLLPVTDAALLSSRADGSILVVRHGKVTRDQVDHAVDRLTQVDARLLGIVFSMVPAKTSGGYGYGYGYGYAPVSGKRRRVEAS